MIGAYKILVSLILWPLWLAYFVIAMSVFLIYMTFFPRKYYHYYVRPMCWFFYLFGCQWLKMDGRVPPPQNGPYLYMINHGSLFDLFAVFFYMKHYVTAVGAIEEFRWPIWGAVGRKYGIVPIQRSNIEKAVHGLENGAAHAPITQDRRLDVHGQKHSGTRLFGQQRVEFDAAFLQLPPL